MVCGATLLGASVTWNRPNIGGSEGGWDIGFIAGSLESANSSILAPRRLFKEVVGKKIRILC